MRDLLFTNASDWRLPVIECKYEDVIGRQLWVLVFSITGCGIDIQQECIHSLIVVKKNMLFDDIKKINIFFLFASLLNSSLQASCVKPKSSIHHPYIIKKLLFSNT
jgi:hypothetical protein